MKYDTKFCFIENNGKNYQLNLTQQYPNAVYAFEQLIAHTRFLLPIGALISGGIFGLSFLGNTPNGMASSLCIGFSAATALCYSPITSFADAISALIRNNKITKGMKNFYDDMRSLEFQKMSRQIKASVCLKEQEKLANNLLKMFQKFQRVNMKKFFRYERKLNGPRELSTAQAFAYSQIEASILSIDKFIFHNFALLKNLCPKMEDFIQYSVGYYNRTVITKQRHRTDEIIKSVLTPHRSKVYNDDILNRESTYATDLCVKLGYIKQDAKAISACESVSSLTKEIRKIQQEEDGILTVGSSDEDEMEY